LRRGRSESKVARVYANGLFYYLVSKTTVFKDEKVKFFLYEREKVNYYALVYPDLKKVRIFELKENSYTKVFDGDRGKFTFNLECPFTVDFGALWKRV
jgi:hypothetical protein